MSNLLKGFTVPVRNDEKRVIDCNAMISEMLVKMRNTVENDEFTDAGFNPGLNPLGVSEVLGDDEHILGNEQAVDTENIEPDRVHKKEMIIAEAEEQAAAIIDKANEDARVIIAQAQAEADGIRNKAREQGLAEGAAKASEEAQAELSRKSQELELLKEELISEYRQKEAEMEPALVDTILKIFADITRSIAMDKRDMILTLVNNVMVGGEASRNFVIRVCNEDAIFLKENKEKIIGAVRRDIHIEIVTDLSMKRNECLIDTDTGVYDCSLDIQLENLINDIKILSCAGE